VWEQTELEALILADNGLTEIERVGDLSRLRMLDLGHNDLTQMPESLGNIAGLSDFLYLPNNRLASLPSSLDG
jgi:Leucine-rich repeat (LRR) protein